VAAAGKLRSFLAGNHEAIERVRPIIETYSSGSILIVSEQPAQANVIKLTANMILTANISLFGQIYALNERWNINQDVTHELLGIFYTHPGLLAYEDRIRNRTYDRPDGEGFSVEGGLKDINAMLITGDQVGVPLPFCSVTREQCVSAMGHGLKDKDWSVLGDTARINAGYSPPNQS
jgi:3-hydroxyisobutyrate dehydrogenase-like beta-hydroxyacid dehydrogenase